MGQLDSSAERTETVSYLGARLQLLDKILRHTSRGGPSLLKFNMSAFQFPCSSL